MPHHQSQLHPTRPSRKAPTQHCLEFSPMKPLETIMDPRARMKFRTRRACPQNTRGAPPVGRTRRIRRASPRNSLPVQSR